VTLRARWVTLRARWVTLRARWVTLRARWVTLRARRATLISRWVGHSDPRRRATNSFHALNAACFLAQVATRGGLTQWGAKVHLTNLSSPPVVLQWTDSVRIGRLAIRVGDEARAIDASPLVRGVALFPELRVFF
jgi:hypothetical protein